MEQRAEASEQLNTCCPAYSMLILAIMSNIKLFFKFFEHAFITKLLLLALLYSLLPLFETFLLFYLGSILGNYFTLAMAASTGLLGILIALGGTRKNLTILKRKIKDGEYPGHEFVHLVGILIGGVLLLTPGFITDFLGFLLFIPVIQNALGKIFIKAAKIDLKELYEYLQLYEIY